MAGPNGGKFPQMPGVTRRPIAPPAGTPAGGEIVTNGPPLKAGQTYSAPAASGPQDLTDDTRRQLRLIGVQDHQQPPAGIQARIKAIHAKFLAAQSEAIQEVAAVGARGNRVPQVLSDISELPEEARQELAAEVQQLMALEAEQAATAAPQAPPANMHPGVGEMAQWLQTTSKRPEVVLDETPQPTKPLRQTSQPTPATEEPAAETTADEAGTADADPKCPCCGFDQRTAFNANPSPHDVQAFMAAVLGGGRFMKEVPIMNGRLVLVFRSLTTAESRMVIRQLRFDVERREISTPAEYYMQMADYRLALGLHEIRGVDGSQFLVNPPIETESERLPRDEHGKVDWTKVKAVQATPLLERLDWFHNEGLTDESLRRTAGNHHQQFQRVVETLEARTADPNFWQGIALPA